MINFGLQLKYKKSFMHIVLGALSLSGTIMLLLLTSRYGAGMTPDSVSYISAARNFAESNGFLTFDGSYLVVQPPLYSIMLALINKITLIDPQISAGYANALLFGLIVYLTGLLLLKHLQSFVLVILGTVSVLFSYAIVQASLMALSEPLFILFVLLFLYYSDVYQTRKNYTSLFILSIVAALACLTRYIGVVLVFTGIICIIIWRKDKKEKLFHSLIFLLISILPIGVWMIRNYFLSFGLVGFRGSSSYTLMENIRLYGNTVISWCFPSNSAGIYFIIIIFLAGAAWAFSGMYRSEPLRKQMMELPGPSLLFILFYTIIILVSSTTTAYDPISDRLLSPVYIPMVFLAFFMSDRIYVRLKKTFNKKLVIIPFIIGMAFLIRYPAMKTMRLIEEYREMSGWGFSADSWRNSKTIEFLTRNEQLAKNYTLYSNEPEAIYILTKINAKRSPLKTFYNSPQTYDVIPNPKDIWLKTDNVCLVWFGKDNRKFLFTIDELKKDMNLAEVADLKDGKIYLFSNINNHADNILHFDEKSISK